MSEQAERTIYAIHQLHKPTAWSKCRECAVPYPCPTADLIRKHVDADA